MIGVKEAVVASKARSDRQVAQLAIEKDGIVVAMRELRNSVAELNEALGLSHIHAWGGAAQASSGFDQREGA
jgi:hypothetical protein